MIGTLNRRQMSKALLGALSTGLPGIRAAETSKAPNVLLILASSLRADTLGCMGHGLVQTANLNLLAAQGARFTNLFTAAPDESAARASILTGRYPKTHGVKRSGDSLGADEVLLPQLFRAAGYRTGFCGSFGLDSAENQKAFDFYQGAMPGAQYDEYLAAALPGFSGSPDDMSVQIDRRSAWAYGRAKVPADHMPDKWISDRGADFLKDSTDGRPSFLLASFVKPRPPWVLPRPYVSSYKTQMVSIPTLPTERPTPATELDAETDYITAKNSQQLRQFRAAYFAAVTYVDYQIGRLLVGLRQAGTRDDTLVVVLSDQGFSLGEGGRMSSGTPTESALHVPMLVRFPNRIEENVVVNRFADTTAIAPTLLEMAGLKIPKGMESQSLASELREPSAEPDGAAFSELGFQTIRTPGWRLTDPKDHKTWVPQLFDLSGDPTESQNLFGKTEHAKVQSDLDARLKKWASTKPAKVRV